MPQGLGLGITTALRLVAIAKSISTRIVLQKPMWSPTETKTSPNLLDSRSTEHSLSEGGMFLSTSSVQTLALALELTSRAAITPLSIPHS